MMKYTCDITFIHYYIHIYICTVTYIINLHY